MISESLKGAHMKDYLPLIQTALWIALILFAILMFQKPLREQIKKGASLKVGPVEIGEIKADVALVQQQVSDLGNKVAEIFLLAMADPMYINLKKLVLGQFGRYEMSGGLKRELYHLRDMGYIHVESIGAIPPQGENLSSYVTVTSTGRKFVEKREDVTRTSF
jgi:hypothetical protein